MRELSSSSIRLLRTSNLKFRRRSPAKISVPRHLNRKLFPPTQWIYLLQPRTFNSIKAREEELARGLTSDPTGPPQNLLGPTLKRNRNAGEWVTFLSDLEVSVDLLFSFSIRPIHRAPLQAHQTEQISSGLKQLNPTRPKQLRLWLPLQLQVRPFS